MCFAGNSPPPKPWERVGTPSGPAPFKPPSGGTTSDIVEASGTAKPGEVVSPAEGNAGFNVNNNTVSRPLPPRPWQQQQQQGYGNSYGGKAIICPHFSSSVLFVATNGNLLIKMQVMVPAHIIHMVDLVGLVVAVGYMEITCIQVMVVYTVVLECMVGRCIITGWEIPTVVWPWVLTIRVLIRLALQHHPQVSGCHSYEW